MNDYNEIIDRLRHFAALDYRYQLQDALAALEPHTEATISGLAEALSDDDSDVRHLAIQILGELGRKAESALQEMIQALDDNDRLVRIVPVLGEQDLSHLRSSRFGVLLLLRSNSHRSSQSRHGVDAIGRICQSHK